MLQAQIDSSSKAEVLDYLEATRKKIFAGVLEGMKEGMQALDSSMLDKLQGSPIISRSGRLAGAILGGIRVSETPQYIIGRIFPDTHDGRNLAQWLEEGFSVPAVSAKLYSFFADATQVFTRGHKAFTVEPHPFMNPSLEQTEPLIMEIIAQKVADAVE